MLLKQYGYENRLQMGWGEIMKLKDMPISETLVIKELCVNELEQVFPLVSQLRTHLSLNEYIKLVKLMQPNGYKIICLYEDERAVSYAGFARLINLYYGDHIWVYELVTDKSQRGKGYGKLLLSYIEKYAKDNCLGCVALSSGLARIEAHQFYESSMQYEKTSYVFKKILNLFGNQENKLEV